MLVTRAISSLAGLVLLASRIACLIVIAWFVVFAVDQSKAASLHQQEELSGPRAPEVHHHASSATKLLDEAARFLTRPFHGITAHSSNVWLTHGLDLVLVLLVYGLAVAFVVRLVRVRV
ncbi:MAG: hypothetical protein ACYCUM_05715 [Solirubrobacteraceae bacterium]